MNTTITIKNEEGEHSVSAPIKSTIDELVDLFVSAAMTAGWSIERIEQAIIEKSYEIQDKKED